MILRAISEYDACMSRWCCALVLALVLLIGSAASAVAPCGCPGDCNGDGRVTIDELVWLVGMQLDDLAGVCGCKSFCTVAGDCSDLNILVVQSQFYLFTGCPS